MNSDRGFESWPIVGYEVEAGVSFGLHGHRIDFCESAAFYQLTSPTLIWSAGPTILLTDQASRLAELHQLPLHGDALTHKHLVDNPVIAKFVTFICNSEYARVSLIARPVDYFGRIWKNKEQT